LSLVSKTDADARVEASLYHRALGYSYDSEEVRVLRDGQVIRVPIRVHMPPDTTAGIFWLKNRQPERWRDRHELDQRVQVEAEPMSDRDLAKALALLIAEAKLQKRLLIDAELREVSHSGATDRLSARAMTATIQNRAPRAARCLCRPVLCQRRLILLRHKAIRVALLLKDVAQHGHRLRRRTMAFTRRWRMVAIEFGICRSVLSGRSSGSVTFGKGRFFEPPGGTRSRGGNGLPFGDQESVRRDA